MRYFNAGFLVLEVMLIEYSTWDAVKMSNGKYCYVNGYYTDDKCTAGEWNCILRKESFGVW